MFSTIILIVLQLFLGLFFYFVSVPLVKQITQNQKVAEALKVFFLTLLIFGVHFLLKHLFEDFDFHFQETCNFNLGSLVFTFILNSALFSYVLTYEFLDNGFHELKEKVGLLFTSYYILKATVIGPILEEIFFRAIFLALYETLSPETGAVLFTLVNGVIFAASHLDNMKQMFFFRCIFGFYASFVLFKTQSIYCSIFLHGYCNFLGPP